MSHALAPRWPTTALGLAVLACALLVGGCADEPPPSGPGPIPVEKLREEAHAAICAYEVRCGLMPDGESCAQLNETEQELLQLLADVVYGKVTYDAAAARACVEAQRAKGCEAQGAVQQKVDETCRGVFQGSVPQGGACLVAGECAGESVCDRSACMDAGACCFGTCTPAPSRVEIGADCTNAACVDEAFCDAGDSGEGGSAPTPTCKARVDNGQSCTDSRACKDGQRCARGEGNGEGKCYVLAKEGERCNPQLSDPCLSIDNWCDPAASTCVKLPGVGQPCAEGGRCLAYAACDGGTCRTRPVAGEACLSDGPACLGDLRCEGEVCIQPATPRVCVPSGNDE